MLSASGQMRGLSSTACPSEAYMFTLVVMRNVLNIQRSSLVVVLRYVHLETAPFPPKHNNTTHLLRDLCRQFFVSEEVRLK